ncbi:MAG: protein kinase [Polyangiaceae bacterium]|nr:protein kinase [Polyangiaceae bacterium]
MQPGDVIGKYTIESDLGEGGMGRVYIARDPALDRRVALKVVRPGVGDETTLKEANARLFREARAAAKLDHPNVVAVFDVGEINGTPYFAMEFVKGKTLREAAADPDVSAPRKLGWLADVARALAAAHRAGIVHRDIKPENVMVRDDGVVKVLDFGIARHVRSSVDPHGATASAALPTLTRDGIAIGTPLYMTPEQIHGDDVDGRSDQFAWAVMVHEVLTGNVPWKSKNESLGLVASILTQPAPSLRTTLTDLPMEVDQVIAKCLSKNPADRFSSMDEVLAALQNAGPASPITKAPAVSLSNGNEPALSNSGNGGNAGGESSQPARTTGQRRYTDDEIRKIVERASEMQGAEAAISHQELLDVAREVGLDEGAVSAAAREISREKKGAKPGDAVVQTPDNPASKTPFKESAPLTPVTAAAPTAEQKTSRTAQRWRDFFRHLMSFFVVNGFVYYFLNQPAWQKWMLFGWGMGVLLHLAGTLFPESDEKKRKEKEREKKWEERIEKAFNQPDKSDGKSEGRKPSDDELSKEERDRAIERAIEQAARDIYRAVKGRRVRVAPDGAESPKMRVTSGEKNEQAAEEEAASEEESAKKHERR